MRQKRRYRREQERRIRQKWEMDRNDEQLRNEKQEHMHTFIQTDRGVGQDKGGERETEEERQERTRTKNRQRMRNGTKAKRGKHS